MLSTLSAFYNITFIFNDSSKIPIFNFMLMIVIIIIIISITVYLFWRWVSKEHLKYEIHKEQHVDVLHCSMKRIRVYRIAKHRSCYYNLKKVIIFPEKIVFDKENFSIKIKKNIAHISKNHLHLSFNIKHIVCLKKRKIHRLNQIYFISTTKNYSNKEIVFLYRNHIFDLEFFNHDYKEILNNFKNSDISKLSLKLIRKKCYLRLNKQIDDFAKKVAD